MRSQKLQQYKKIKNSPMRSPSPDYACKNRTPRTEKPLLEIQQKNNIINASPVRFPNVPSQLMKKKNINQIENIAPPTQKQQSSTKNTTTPKLNRQISAPLQEIASFEPIMEEINQIQLNQIVKKVQEIYYILFPSMVEKESISKRYSLDISSYIFQTNEKLDQIREQICKLAKLREISGSFEANFKTFGNNQSNIKHNPQKKTNFLKSQHIQQGIIYDSPIKAPGNHEQQSSFSIFQLNQLQTQNSKLRRQVILLKLQLQGSQKRNYSTSKLSDQVQKSPSKSSLKSDVGVKKYRINMMKEVQGNIKQLSQSQQKKSETTYKFMKQKIGYLQGQLQNKMDKAILIQKEKNQEIKILREKLTQANKLIESEMDSYKKVIQSQKQKIKNLQQAYQELQKKKDSMDLQIFSQQKMLNRSRRQRRNSEQITNQTYMVQIPISQQKKNNKLSQRRELFWDLDQIMSIQQDHEKQQSMISQAQRVDFEQIFSVKKYLGNQVQRMKKQYEQIIYKNLKNYNNQIYSFQSKLRQLKQFIQNQNLDQYPIICAHCQLLCNKLVERQIQITDLEVQNNVLKSQVLEQKKETNKIKSLLAKITRNQKSSSEQGDKKFKRKSQITNKSLLQLRRQSSSKKKGQEIVLDHSQIRNLSISQEFQDKDI